MISNGKQNTSTLSRSTKRTPPSLSDIGAAVQDELKAVKKERDYFKEKLAEKSTEIAEIQEQIRELKEIESRRTKDKDFKSAASLPTDNESQVKIASLQKRNEELEDLLAVTKFEAYLELSERIIPVIIIIDRAAKKATVTLDISKIDSLTP